MTNVVTADAQGNLQCAAPIESVLQHSTTALVTAVDVSYTASSGNLTVSVSDITGATKQDLVTLPTSTQNISTWSNGTTQSIVLGSDGKLYLANPTGAPSTHNPVAKTNDVDWFGAFATLNDLLQYALSGGSFLARSGTVTTASTTPPTNPSLGDKWVTSSTTVAPYPANTVMEWIGTKWVVSAGVPTTVMTSTGTAACNPDGSGRLVDVDLTAFSNDLNSTIDYNGITLPADGFYRITMQFNPTSNVTLNAAGSYEAVYGIMSGIYVDGVLLTVFEQNGRLAPVQQTLAVGNSCFLEGYFNAGQLVEFKNRVTQCTLNFAVTVKVMRLY